MNTYIVIFNLKSNRTISVGALGNIEFERGFYVYVGSAKRALAKRIERHASKTKKLHWHIDYLSLEADYVTSRLSVLPECDLAKEVEKLGGKGIPKFGCSDCKCKSHLFFFKELPKEWSNK